MSDDQAHLAEPTGPQYDPENYVMCKGLVRNPVTGHMEEIVFWVHKDHPAVHHNLSHLSIGEAVQTVDPLVQHLKEKE